MFHCKNNLNWQHRLRVIFESHCQTKACLITDLWARFKHPSPHKQSKNFHGKLCHDQAPGYPYGFGASWPPRYSQTRLNEFSRLRPTQMVVVLSIFRCALLDIICTKFSQVSGSREHNLARCLFYYSLVWWIWWFQPEANQSIQLLFSHSRK